MRIEELWTELSKSGVAVPQDVQRTIGLRFNQERVLIRPPAVGVQKASVLEFGTSVPATFVARKLGVTVRTVQRYRALLR